MSWAESLIKLSTYEAEVLQKRLAEIVDRRTAVEMRLLMLEAEGEAETAFMAQEAAAGIYRAGFFEGLKLRKAKIQSEIDVILIEETGAREALAEAFETQKKYEHIAQNLKIEARKVQGRRDSAALDELGLRKKAS
ncbi:MAG: flagellar export protein FliJ [Phenylobacterium sp.]|uniref:flagellar export protein FliJ n=1 Tax=Phenylobacterium sp. TaxID=1871053 RepID=UPI001224A680|nr:flagellar export protein FliJ [Phenylobacterium sp.]TAJ74547.1 MAG: flagellar export protein FliJ [Phenylobacterium sp.]